MDEKGQELPKGSPRRKRFIACPPTTAGSMLDFGHVFWAVQSLKQSCIFPALEPLFESCPESLALMAYRLCQPGAMMHYSSWAAGNALCYLWPETTLSSQAISRVLAHCGQEAVQQSFFKRYLSAYPTDPVIIIDATSLPNQIRSEYTAWGYSAQGIEQQIRFHCVVDQTLKRPLYYRTVPGHIADICTLETTCQELSALGLQSSFALLDAGYCSAHNLAQLRQRRIDFLMRCPAGRTLYKTLVQQYAAQLEQPQYAMLFRNRLMFVQSITVDDLYGAPGQAYLILDPVRKVQALQMLMAEKKNSSDEERLLSEEERVQFHKAGIFMLISSKAISCQDILHAYYTRQSVEQIFGFAKSDLDFLPIRCHSEPTIRGYLFLQCLILIIFIEMREKLKDQFTVEQAMILTRNLKCKIINQHLIIQELTKEQKKIFELSDIIVPTSIAGI